MGKDIKTIAKFMGYKIENQKFQTLEFHSSNESHWEWDEGEIVTLDGEEVSDYNNEPYFSLKDLPFDSEWDWLMPVVEKIESLGYTFKIKGSTVVIKHSDVDFEDIFVVREDFDKKEAVFIGVLKFIKRYNHMTKSPPRLIDLEFSPLHTGDIILGTNTMNNNNIQNNTTHNT